MKLKIDEVLDWYAVYFLYAWYYPYLAMSLASQAESLPSLGLFQVPKGKF